MEFYLGVLYILFGVVSILNYLPSYIFSKMASTIHKICRVPGISISKLCKNCHNLAQCLSIQVVACGLHEALHIHIAYEEKIKFMPSYEMLQRISYTKSNLQGSLNSIP